MAVNNWTSKRNPSYVKAGRDCNPVNASSCDGAHRSYWESHCNRHQPSNNSGWGTLNTANTNHYIIAEDIISIMHALNTAITFWYYGSNAIQVNSGNNVNISPRRGQKIKASEWNAILSKLSQFSSLSGQSFSNVGTNDTVTANRYNNMVSAYHKIGAACKCNSDIPTGCVCNTNCSCNYSDKRTKENIKELNKSIIDIPVYEFTYKKEYQNKLGLDNNLKFGVMAQELQDNNLSELVHVDDNGILNVDYTMMIPLLLKEIQENRKRITELEGKLK